MDNNPTSDGSKKNDGQLQAGSSENQTAPQGKKMWPSSDGLINSENGRDSGHENIELLVQDLGARQSPYPESLFFRDGQRKIDFVLVYESSGDEDEKAAKRKIYEDNLIKHGLELEEEISLQVLWFYYQISDS